MTNIKVHDLEFGLYIPQSEIERQTARVAREIEAQYAGCGEPPVLLVTLSGAMPWAAQLMGALNIDVDLAFVKCSSYGSSTTSCGSIELQLAPTINLDGKDVIVVEDVVDSGLTWEFLHKFLNSIQAKSVRIATMTYKPTAYKGCLPIDYAGFEIDDVFVIGNGLDYNQRGRNLKDIYQLCK